MQHAQHRPLEHILEAAVASCASAGETLTPLRRQVLELLWRREGPAKAYDLLDDLKLGHPGAKPPTIYRALEFLVRLGFAHRIESLNAFIACDLGACSRSMVFLICERCSATVEVDAGHALEDMQAAAKAAGFALSRTIIEASGACARCQT
jgi:Fur family zinc uptake transcriptional regulator